MTGERGSVVLGLAAGACCMTLALMAAMTGGVAVLRARAGGAADLAALAAVSDGCDMARVIAARNGAALRDCRPDAGGMHIEVGIAAPAWLLRLGAGPDIRATARAGLH